MHKYLLLVIIHGLIRDQHLVVLLHFALIFCQDSASLLLYSSLVELHFDLDKDLLLHLFDALPMVLKLGLLQDLDHLLLLSDLLFLFL